MLGSLTQQFSASKRKADKQEKQEKQEKQISIER